MDAKITVNFIIRDVCEQSDIDAMGGENEGVRFKNVVANLIYEEGLMSVVESMVGDIIEIKRMSEN